MTSLAMLLLNRAVVEPADSAALTSTVQTLSLIHISSGSLELGVGQELYHMEKGDIGFVFPDVIHHYQVLDVYKRQSLFSLGLIQSLFFATATLQLSGVTVGVIPPK